MEVKLNSMTIENFKGVKSFDVDFGGESAVIKAENGIGKTTVYDAFLWLFFGKDSTGRKEFELRPLDINNQPIKGVQLSVGAEITIDGTPHTFHKKHIEKVVKKQLRGYETLCWIDEVPKKVGEYNEYINNVMDEENFRLLTDLSYFNSKMHWKDRRTVLLAVAGEIGTPEGFVSLLTALKGRTIDEYKKVLNEQKKRHENERDEINPRLDEIQRGLDEFVGSPDPALVASGKKAGDKIENQRRDLQDKIIEHDLCRSDMLKKEKERQENITALNKLNNDRFHREVELKNDNTGVQVHLDKKAKIEKVIAERMVTVNNAENKLSLENARLANKKSELKQHLSSLDAVRKEYTVLADTAITEACYACGQKLPADKLTENEEKHQAKRSAVAIQGNSIKAMVEQAKQNINGIETGIKGLLDDLEKAVIELREVEAYKEEQYPILDEMIENRTAFDPKQDQTWVNLGVAIEKAEMLIGPPVSEQIDKMNTERTMLTNEVAKLDKFLASADRIKKDKVRIQELEAKEVELAQVIADIEKQLNDIDQYVAEESRMIEAAVNDKFKCVEFKMFKELLNGGFEECCEATYAGVPYQDMSTGQQIYVGIDIINVLSSHFDASVCMFIDHSESLTMPVEAECQVIGLYAQEGVMTLTVSQKGKAAK